jgi:hypothetical protein
VTAWPSVDDIETDGLTDGLDVTEGLKNVIT